MLTVRKMRVSVASVGKNILGAFGFGLTLQPLETAARRVGVFAHVVPAIYVSVLGDVGGDREATRVVGRVLSDDFEDGTFHVIDHDKQCVSLSLYERNRVLPIVIDEVCGHDSRVVSPADIKVLDKRPALKAFIFRLNVKPHSVVEDEDFIINNVSDVPAFQ